ncbi:hypothetical protein TNCV_4908971 [Trichonephila clavipes]|uniref:Uncharacterized protein n=1 Tax=Trichonephila clavipes TaxID=2585209 RepID=A0A8X6RT00_TRICX|nr:hypothetical protein TNCV_4908971 [Trichonephila clavipes]
MAVVPDFHKRILLSDEAHFWLNGYVNKQNCRIWSEANPQVYVETPLHPEKLTVWCALWAAPYQVELQHINFCTVQLISKLPPGSSKMMPTRLYGQHFAMFPLNRHYNSMKIVQQSELKSTRLKFVTSSGSKGEPKKTGFRIGKS